MLYLVNVEGRLHVAGSLSDDLAPEAASIAIRANGDKLTRAEDPCTLAIWETHDGVRTRNFHTFGNPVKQLAAFDSGFAILHEDGAVATMGDSRFPAPLGRAVSEDQYVNSPRKSAGILLTGECTRPAHLFAMLVDLELPGDLVKHISASGYAVAALTNSGSVYIWGQHLPSTTQEQHFFPGLCSTANYIEIGGGKDILDIALGETHAIALTCEGELYVIGNNENGQLGIPSLPSTTTWTKLEFTPPNGSRVTGVAAGPRTSFILVSANPAR